MINIKEKYCIFIFNFVSNKRTTKGHYQQQCKVTVYLLDSNINAEKKEISFSVSIKWKIQL